MNVLIVFNHPAPYKVKCFNELAKYINLDVIFERTKANDRPKLFYSENKINFHIIPIKSFNLSNENSFSFGVKNYIKNNYQKYDLIIMNGYSTFSEMIAISYMKKHHIPYILLINGGVIKKENKIKSAIKKYFITGAKYFLSPAKEANKYLLHYGVKENQIKNYRYSSLNKNDILLKSLNNDEKIKIKEKYHLPKGKIFVSIGQFINRKNNMELIKIFENLPYTLYLIGSGKEKNKYIKYIKDKNIKNVIIKDFLPKKDLLDFIRAFDAFITLSKEDIYGHTTIEALSQGLATISSKNVISSKEYIKNMYNGILVDINNKDEIISAIKNIKDYSKSAIESVKEINIENTVKDYIKIFEDLKK